jgi:ParB family chromosome partitioning protein
VPRPRKDKPVYFQIADLEPQSVPQVSAAPIRQMNAELHLPGAMTVAIDQLVPDPHQPRKQLDPEGLAELAASIGEHGVLQPLVVREDGFLTDERARYRIIAGERRYRAAQQAGLTRLPVIVRESDAAGSRILQLIENIQRADLDPVDEAHAIKELMDLENLDTRSMGHRLHRSHAYVQQRLRLIEHQDVADEVRAGGVSVSVAREVAKIGDGRIRRRILNKAKDQSLQADAARRLVQQALRKEEPASLDVPTTEISWKHGFQHQSKTGEIAPIHTRLDEQDIASPAFITADTTLAELVMQAGGKASVTAILAWAEAEGFTMISELKRVIDGCDDGV